MVDEKSVPDVRLLKFLLIDAKPPARPADFGPLKVTHPGGNPGANFKSISHRCHPMLLAFVWELTKDTINLPLGCLQDGG